MKQRLLHTSEAAEFLGLSVSYLEKDRIGKREIPFIKIGRSAIRYDLRTLDEYLERKSAVMCEGSKK